MNNCGNCANYDRTKKEHTEVCGQCITAYVNNERQDPSNWKPIPKTNSDRIRAMSDVELADFLCRKFECSNCVGSEFCNSKDGNANGLVKWLQQPAEEE